MKSNTKVTIVVGASIAGYYVYRWYGSFRDRQVVNDLLSRGDFFIQDLLREYASEIYDYLYEISQTSSRVRSNLRERNMLEMISETELNKMLLPEESLATFRQVEIDLLAKHGIDLRGRSLESIIEDYYVNVSAPRENVVKYVLAVKTMIEDARSGSIPILMGCVLPLEINKNRALQIQDSILREKRLRIAEALNKEGDGLAGGSLVTDPELSSMMMSITKEAEVEVLRCVANTYNYAAELQGLGDTELLHTFKSLIGFYCKEDDAFATKRSGLHDKHTTATLGIITTLKTENNLPDALRTHPLLTAEGGAALDTFYRPPLNPVFLDDVSNVQVDVGKDSILDSEMCILAVNDFNVSQHIMTLEKLRTLYEKSIYKASVAHPNISFKTTTFVNIQKLMLDKSVEDLNKLVVRFLEAHNNTDITAWECLPVFLLIQPYEGGHRCVRLSRDIQDILEFLSELNDKIMTPVAEIGPGVEALDSKEGNDNNNKKEDSGDSRTTSSSDSSKSEDLAPCTKVDYGDKVLDHVGFEEQQASANVSG